MSHRFSMVGYPLPGTFRLVAERRRIEFHLIRSTYDDLPDGWMTMKQIRELRPHLSQDQLTLATSLNTMKLAFGTIVSIDKEDIDGFETLNVSDDDIRYDIRDRNFLIERLPGRQTCEPSWHRLTTIPLHPSKQQLLTPNDEK